MTVQVNLDLNQDQTHTTTMLPVPLRLNANGSVSFLLNGSFLLVEQATCVFDVGSSVECLRITPQSNVGAPNLDSLSVEFHKVGTADPASLGAIRIEALGSDRYGLHFKPPAESDDETTWNLGDSPAPPIMLKVVIRRA